MLKTVLKVDSYGDVWWRIAEADTGHIVSPKKFSSAIGAQLCMQDIEAGFVPRYPPRKPSRHRMKRMKG